MKKLTGTAGFLACSLLVVLVSCAGDPAPDGIWRNGSEQLTQLQIDSLRNTVSEEGLRAYVRYFGFPTKNVRATGWYAQTNQQKLFVLSLEPAHFQQRILMLHGYLAHAGHFTEPARFFLEKGYAVTLVDLPGHGLSAGAPASINSFSEYGEALHTILQSMDTTVPLSVIGHSTGCAALYEYLLHHDAVFKKMVFAAPLFKITSQEIKTLMNNLAGSEPFKIPRITVVSQGSINNPDFISFSQTRDPFYPAMYAPRWLTALSVWNGSFGAPQVVGWTGQLYIVQGDMDDVVDWRFNLPWYETAFPKHKVVKYRDYPHTILNVSNDLLTPVLQDIAVFLADDSTL